MQVTKGLLVLALILFLILPTTASADEFAVWLEGSTTSGGNGIPTALMNAGHSVTLVTNANLSTPGFLNSFDALVVSRFGANFGSGLPAGAIANVMAYVGSGAGQGNVALVTYDASDNLFGAGVGDPFDANVNAQFIHAAEFASASKHGYVGEFNGSAMAVTTNANGFTPLDLLPGSAGALSFFAQSAQSITPDGVGHPVAASPPGYPFTSVDSSSFRTAITGAGSNVRIAFADGVPSVIANAVIPEPASFSLIMLGVAGLIGYRICRRNRAA